MRDIYYATLDGRCWLFMLTVDSSTTCWQLRGGRDGVLDPCPSTRTRWSTRHSTWLSWSIRPSTRSRWSTWSTFFLVDQVEYSSFYHDQVEYLIHVLPRRSGGVHVLLPGLGGVHILPQGLDGVLDPRPSTMTRWSTWSMSFHVDQVEYVLLPGLGGVHVLPQSPDGVLDPRPHRLQDGLRNQVQRVFPTERHWGRNRREKNGWRSASGN